MDCPDMMEAEPQVFGTTTKIFPLALPKGQEKLCELCQRPANLQCSKCLVTFYWKRNKLCQCYCVDVTWTDHWPEPPVHQKDLAYCSPFVVFIEAQMFTSKAGEKRFLINSHTVLQVMIHHVDHQQADWVGIHERICRLLVPIRTVTLSSMQREGLIETHLRKTELIELSKTVSESKLSEGKHLEALPAAQFALRCSIDVHGPSTLQLVPAYLLLAEANMGLRNLDLVSELLSQAEWVVLKSPECGHGVHQRLHRSLGRLHTATGNYEAALFHFANDIYYSSEEYGLDSTVTAGGYFLMADVFSKQGKMPVVHSLYERVAQTWHGHLTNLLKFHVQYLQNPDTLQEPFYDKAQRVEVDEMLGAILEFEQKDSGQNSAQIAMVAHCLAMLWFFGGHFPKALGFGSTALQASQLIPNHDLTEAIQSLLQLLQGLQKEEHTGPD